jgi:hypothetical protein
MAFGVSLPHFARQLESSTASFLRFLIRSWPALRSPWLVAVTSHTLSVFPAHDLVSSAQRLPDTTSTRLHTCCSDAARCRYGRCQVANARINERASPQSYGNREWYHRRWTANYCRRLSVRLVSLVLEVNSHLSTRRPSRTPRRDRHRESCRRAERQLRGSPTFHTREMLE